MHNYIIFRTEIYILQRGVQRKQGVVIYMTLYTSLLYNSTPIRCTPHPLHPHLQSIQALAANFGNLRAPIEHMEAWGGFPSGIYVYIYIYIYIHAHTYIYNYLNYNIYIYTYRERERERERENTDNIYIYIYKTYIYIYIYMIYIIHIYIYIYTYR